MPDDKDKDVPQNISLVAFQPPWNISLLAFQRPNVAIGPKIFS